MAPHTFSLSKSRLGNRGSTKQHQHLIQNRIFDCIKSNAGCVTRRRLHLVWFTTFDAIMKDPGTCLRWCCQRPGRRRRLTGTCSTPGDRSTDTTRRSRLPYKRVMTSGGRSDRFLLLLDCRSEALLAETKVEKATSQSKSGTSVHVR